MNTSAFNNLDTFEQVRRLDVALSWVHPTNAWQVFGLDPKKAKKVYRKLTKLTHPDSAGAGAAAESAFKRLNELWRSAETQLDNHTYAQPTPIPLRGGGGFMGRWWTQDEIADIYLGDNNHSLIRLVRSGGDHDLLDNERTALERLQLGLSNPEVQAVLSNSNVHIERYFALDSAAAIHEDGRHMLISNLNQTLPPVPQLFTLAQLGEFYNQQLDPKHIGWIWRRLLTALGFAHRCGLIHGAVLPENIWLDVENHGLVLVNWIHASLDQSPIRSINRDRRDFYPPEVIDKQLPLPGLDFYMGAKSMRWACQNMPEALERYMNWCMLESSLARPDKFETVYNEFTRTIFEHLAWKREFVEMTGLVRWEWFR